MSKRTDEQLRNDLEQVLKEYYSIYEHVWASGDWQNSFRSIIAKDIPEAITDNVALEEYYRLS